MYPVCDSLVKARKIIQNFCFPDTPSFYVLKHMHYVSAAESAPVFRANIPILLDPTEKANPIP
jgi:hypothetical protein